MKPTTRKYQAFIFDMDGVVVDSEPLHERAFLDVLEEIGFGRTHGIDFPAYYGKSDLVVWRDFIARHRPAQSLEELLARKEEKFGGLLREEPIFSGLPELLAKLSPRCPLALASGSRHSTINAVLAMRGLRRFFRVVVSSEDVAHGKPAPDIFLRTATLLDVAPGECCVIEDSASGVEAALAAGMTVIAITNSLPAEKLSRASNVVETYAEIEQLLLRSR
jgi:beta-phosphoglucomutase-like phosphatase (HAD superfamily)